VQQRGDWHKIALALRESRTRSDFGDKVSLAAFYDKATVNEGRAQSKLLLLTSKPKLKPKLLRWTATPKSNSKLPRVTVQPKPARPQSPQRGHKPATAAREGARFYPASEND
jgi:hypothetical protein